MSKSFRFNVYFKLRWLPVVQSIFGHFSDTTTLMNISFFFSTRHENRTALEYLEAILDNVSVTIAT